MPKLVSYPVVLCKFDLSSWRGVTNIFHSRSNNTHLIWYFDNNTHLIWYFDIVSSVVSSIDLVTYDSLIYDKIKHLHLWMDGVLIPRKNTRATEKYSLYPAILIRIEITVRKKHLIVSSISSLNPSFLFAKDRDPLFLFFC